MSEGEKPMRRTKQVETWVVYRMTLPKTLIEVNAMCEQSEWEAMQRENPGVHALIRSGITSEEEAEKLARGTTGDIKPRKRS
jgi:hypothetical protein